MSNFDCVLTASKQGAIHLTFSKSPTKNPSLTNQTLTKKFLQELDAFKTCFHPISLNRPQV
jgi:hypothetical protein